MENCPYCGAPGAAREAVDGCCFVCGMVLPDMTASSASADAPAAEASDSRRAATVVHQPVPSAATIDDDVAEPPAIQLIQPRNLAPEYARRVTAAWQATKSPFQNPRETLNSSSSKAGDPDNLLIATRSLGSVEEERRADYELTEVIGEGNMGTVWSARQASLDREVAVKMPKHTAGGSTVGREQFISEVVVTGQLDHPNIVPIYDLGRDESGQLFYAMKRVEGRPWDACMHETGRPRQDNVEVLMKVCDAIRFAHDRGVIHRDIKPQNIMVGKYGEVSVMDWGIALRLDAATRSSSIIKLSPAGTPAYMAPEMATANAADIGPHTDVYLLGACLYEIINGEPPHPPPKDSHDRLVQQNACLLVAARNVITPARESGELIDIAYKAMATDISKRYQTVAEFQNAIREYFSHAESIALAERGQAHLATALEMRNGVYEDYAKARFAFGEALQLWPENAKARSGLAQATIAYADKALNDGNYSLGISLLDPANEQHADLLKRLTAAKRRADRNRTVALVSAGAAVCFLILGIGVSSFFAVRESIAKKAETEAKNNAIAAQKREALAKDRAEGLNTQLVSANKTLETQKQDLADKNQTIEKTNEDLDGKNKLLAQQIEETEKQKNKAEQASYQSEIGLAAEHVQRNAFAAARDILEKQVNNNTQAALRNWEWGHLAYLATQPTIEQFEIKGLPRIESVALSPDQNWIAAGTDNGDVHVWWRPAPQKEPLVLPAGTNGATVPVVAISSDNRLLVTAVGNEVRFWELPAGDPGRQLKQAGPPLRYSSPILSVALSPNADLVLTSARDSRAQLWSRSQPTQPPRVFTGHLSGPVWQARFSPTGQQIVTAGADESVRIWDINSGQEVRRLDGHRDPVYAAEFSPDGSYVVSGGEDRRLLVWDLESSDAPASAQELIRDRLRSAQEPIDNAGHFRQLGEHGAAIRSISFAPDGQVIYSASQDNTLCVWDVSQGPIAGKLSKTLRGHGGWVSSCVAADDGQHVLSGSYDGRVFLWDAQNYAFPRVLRAVSSRSLSDLRLTSVAASPDSKWIATAAQNGTVTVWDMQQPLNPAPQPLSEGHDWQATTAAYFSGGSRLLTAGGDNSAVVWDTRLGNQLLRIGGSKASAGTGWRGVAAASHDGRWIATGSWSADEEDNRFIAKIWDAESGRLVASLAAQQDDRSISRERPEATAIAFAPDDAMVFVGDQHGRCFLFNTSDGSLVKSFSGHRGKISAAGFLPDGRLLTASSDLTVAKWNIAEIDGQAPQPELILSHRDRVVAMDISSDGRRVITAADSKNDEAVLRLWNIETGEETYRLTLAELRRTLNVTSSEGQKPIVVRSVALHANAPQALVTVFDPNKVFDPTKGQSPYQVGRWEWQNAGSAFQPELTRLDDTSLAVYAPDRPGAILTVGGRGARLRLANQANQVVMSYRPQTGVQSVSFSPDGNLLAAAGNDGSIKLWRFDEPSGRWLPERKLMGQHRGAVLSVAFHPERNTTLLSAGADGTAKLWERGADDWNVVATLGGEGPRGAVNQAVFAPMDENGAADIVTADDDGKVKIWNLAGELLDELPPHDGPNGPVRCVAVSPDRRWIVYGVGIDAYVWNRALPDAKPRKLPGHWADITALAFSPDGMRLLTAARDFNVKLWDTSAWNADAADGNQPNLRELLTLEGHTDSVRGISFLAHIAFPSIVTAGEDGQVILWPSVSISGEPAPALGRR